MEFLVCPVTVSAASDSDRARLRARAALQHLLTRPRGLRPSPCPSLLPHLCRRRSGRCLDLPHPAACGSQAGKRSRASGPVTAFRPCRGSTVTSAQFGSARSSSTPPAASGGSGQGCSCSPREFPLLAVVSVVPWQGQPPAQAPALRPPDGSRAWRRDLQPCLMDGATAAPRESPKL